VRELGIGVATGEHCANRIVFKQLLQARAIDFCQIDSCRLGGVNENLAVILMAAKYGVPVCPHAGGVGLCEYVQHLSMFDYIAVSGTMDGRVIEYVDHLHEHFEDPVVVRGGRYMAPTKSRLQHHDARRVAARPSVSWRRSLAGAGMNSTTYPRVASLKTAEAFRRHLEQSGIPLAFDDALAAPAASPLAQPIEVDGVRVGNRFCILPMEGWDGTRDGEPTDLTRRRWRNFGTSGAKLMWGGEAVAVRHDGRANPHQLMMSSRTVGAIAALREELVAAHRERFGANADSDLYVGLQLTHSGRYARPDVYDRPAPIAACANPILDRRFPNGVRVFEDSELDALVDDFVAAARLARDAGFRFVDVKACHGYLGHELLGARTRSGPYGGSIEGRTHFMRRVIEAIRSVVSGLGHRRPPVGVRHRALSQAARWRLARPRSGSSIRKRRSGLALSRVTNTSMRRWMTHARSCGCWRASASNGSASAAGSPYYNPHVQRPATFPPLDGYEPPEDPLRGVWRQIQATAILKRDFPRMVFVGSAYSYLQEWLPYVGQHNVREGLCDFIGLGRIALSYPDLPSDVLSGAPLKRTAFCRTFSDCTTGPRLGLVSGCYPLDPFYTARPEAARIRDVRTHAREEVR
jgi:2,4-dienoyl-CoA reductase-like NADH-dependent reductase (Old Yellow Enzyme family)